MMSPMDASNPMNRDRIRSLLTGRPGIGPLIFAESLDSTNTELRARALAGGAEAGTALIAERQTAGKGRRERGWVSVPGKSLTFSILAANPVPSEPAFLAVAVALAVADAMRDAATIDPRIKWPNDIYVDGAKAAGILIEAFTREGAHLAVIGVGINVNAAPEIESRHAIRAGSLAAAAGRPVDRSLLLARTLIRLDDYLTGLREGRGGDMVRHLQSRSLLVGRMARFERAGKVHEGRVLGHAADLAIILETRDGTITLPAAGTDLLEFRSAGRAPKKRG
jgi:BirA family biotin operon repressor/biotin-[acetyl-CoA-carboxylase] ligase